MPADAAGFRRPRPAMVPGQSATCGGRDRARPALGVAASLHDRHRVLPYRAALARVPAAWNPDLVAGAVRAAGIFSEGILAVSTMARAGPCSREMGVRRHHGDADRAQADGLYPATD